MKLLEIYLLNSNANNTSTNENNSIINDGILLLSRYAPSFILKIINQYIVAYNHGEIEGLDRLDIENLKKVISNQITIEKELVEACMVLSNDKKEVLKNFMEKIS